MENNDKLKSAVSKMRNAMKAVHAFDSTGRIIFEEAVRVTWGNSETANAVSTPRKAARIHSFNTPDAVTTPRSTRSSTMLPDLNSDSSIRASQRSKRLLEEMSLDQEATPSKAEKQKKAKK